MPAAIIPLTNNPNQVISVTGNINGSNLTLQIFQYYNRFGGFWCFDIYSATGTPLVTSVPLLTGDWPGANILAPYEYLQIGEMFVINQNASTTDYPNDNNLSIGYALLWDNNVGSGVAPGYPTAPIVGGSGDWSSYPVSILENYL